MARCFLGGAGTCAGTGATCFGLGGGGRGVAGVGTPSKKQPKAAPVVSAWRKTIASANALAHATSGGTVDMAARPNVQVPMRTGPVAPAHSSAARSHSNPCRNVPEAARGCTPSHMATSRIQKEVDEDVDVDNSCEDGASETPNRMAPVPIQGVRSNIDGVSTCIGEAARRPVSSAANTRPTGWRGGNHTAHRVPPRGSTTYTQSSFSISPPKLCCCKTVPHSRRTDANGVSRIAPPSSQARLPRTNGVLCISPQHCFHEMTSAKHSGAHADADAAGTETDLGKQTGIPLFLRRRDFLLSTFFTFFTCPRRHSSCPSSYCPCPSCCCRWAAPALQTMQPTCRPTELQAPPSTPRMPPSPQQP